MGVQGNSRRVWVTAMVVASLIACADQDATSPAVAPETSPYGAVQPTPPQQQGRDRKDTPWRTMSDEQFAAEVRRAGGRVTIGLKAPDAAEGVDNSGRVLASAAAIGAGKETLRALGVEPSYQFKRIPAIVATVPAELAVAVRRNPRVDYIEPSVPGKWTSQVTPWGVTRVNAPAAWSYTTGSGAKLLIIDSGVGSDIRDLHIPVAWRCISGPVNDNIGHGTFVAGVAGALDNSVDVIGVAHGVNLWSANIEVSGVPDPAEAACSVDVARANNVDVVNMSFEVPPYTALTDGINGGYNYDDMIFVAGVGNNAGAVRYPATLSAVIGVTATFEESNAHWGAANTGSAVELSAPGVNILSTSLPTGTVCSTGGYTATCNGTSFAAPHVSGAAALLRARYPTWSNTAIRNRLRNTATDLGSSGVDATFGYGLLNVERAVRMSVSIMGPSAVYAGTSSTWSASITGGRSPFSYQWYIDGTPAGTGSSINYTAGSSDFLLELVVSDADGDSATASKSVSVLSCPPPQVTC